jgi:hypothetical protein
MSVNALIIKHIFALVVPGYRALTQNLTPLSLGVGYRVLGTLNLGRDRMEISKLLTEHPTSVGETYAQHCASGDRLRHAHGAGGCRMHPARTTAFSLRPYWKPCSGTAS